MNNLGRATKITLVQAPLATGTSSTGLAGTVIDTKNFHGCLFVGTLGTAATTDVAHMYVQESSGPTSTGTFKDLDGMTVSSTAGGQDDKLMLIDIVKPVKRFLKPRIERDINVEWGGTVAHQYLADSLPTTHPSSTLVGAYVLGASPTT